MKAILFTGENTIEYTEVPEPELQAEEVLVRVHAVGICASDEELLAGTHTYLKRGLTTYPVLPGHEWSGEIVRCGASVPDGVFKAGERVTADVTYACAHCEMCKRGRFNLCPNRGVIGSFKNRPGAFAEYIAVHYRHLYRLPDTVSYDEAALTEPAATALYALLRSGLQPGGSVAVIGDGPIGLLCLAYARAMGAGTCFLVGSWDEKLAIGRSLGATHTINYHRADVPEMIADLTNGRGCDFVYESSGNTTALAGAVEALAPGGSITLLSFYREEEFAVPMNKIITRDANVFGVLASPNAFAPALQLMADGQVNVRPLLTHTFPLQETAKAFAVMQERKECRVKMILHP